MAHDEAVRGRAQLLFINGRRPGAIARETGVSRATLQRWRKEDEWDELRQRNRQLEREAQALTLALTRAARESGDPQQTFAAVQAAKIAGLAEAQPIHPAPAEVAKALLLEMEEDPELGPIVRRKRKQIIERILNRVERIEARV